MNDTLSTQLRDPETGKLPERESRVRVTDEFGCSTEARIVSYFGPSPGFMTWVVFKDQTGTDSRSLQERSLQVEVLERAGGLSFEHDVLGVLGRST